MKNTTFKKHEVEDYEQKRYRGWDQRMVDWREKGILRKILNRTKENATRVLDIPSGYGRLTEILLGGGHILVSSDLSFHMVNRARERSGHPSTHLGVVADAKRGLPFRRGAFPIILSMRFFHHLHQKEDRESVLQEFSGLSPKWLILSYYKKTWIHLIQRKLRRKVMRAKREINMISSQMFQEEIKKFDFEVVKTFPLFRGIHAQCFVLLKRS